MNTGEVHVWRVCLNHVKLAEPTAGGAALSQDVRLFPGGHFYLQSCPAEFRAALEADLA